MPDCSRVGEIMSDAEMKEFCSMPFGTVRWNGDAPNTNEAIIVTRLGVEDDASMPHSDWITENHFYLVAVGIREEGVDIVLRQATSHNPPTLRLFYRRGTGKHFQYLGPIQFEAAEEHPHFRAFRFKRLCPTALQHAD